VIQLTELGEKEPSQKKTKQAGESTQPAHPKEPPIQFSCPTCTLEVEVSNTVDGITSQIRKKSHTQ